MSNKRVVITGIGAVTPLGLNTEALWNGLLHGSCGISTISAFDPVKFKCKLAGQVPDYSIKDYVPKSFRKITKLMSRDIELAVIAAKEAFASSGLITKGVDPENFNVIPTDIAVNIGAGLISCDLVEIAPAIAHSVEDGKFSIKKWGREGLELVTPLWLLKYLPNMLACHIAILHDIQGPSNTITCAEASGHLAVIEASQVILRGNARVALAGGAEAKVNPFILMRQELIERSNTQSNDNPAAACRPFDADAKGAIFGEGAAMVVIEDHKHAVGRNAKILAEIAGCGQSTCCNSNYENVDPDGKGIQIAIEKALDDAELTHDKIDLVIPHGTGIPADDLAEAAAIERIFGTDSKVNVWPTKSMISNTGAASTAVDLVAAIFAINNSVIPAAKNFTKPADGINLNIATSSVKKDINYVLCCGYTYGGQTTTVILKRP